MKTLIIYQSIHHQNTAKVALAIGDVLEAKLVTVSKAVEKDLVNNELIGFGSGIYFGTFGQQLFKFVQRLPDQSGKKAFLFYTSGIGRIPIINQADSAFKEALRQKCFTIIGSFGCRGWDTYPILVRPFGGISKGRPTQKDLTNAKEWCKNTL